MVPAQTVVAEGKTETPTGSPGRTVMMIAVLVAGFPEVQGSEEVISQVITSPPTGT